ncbi:MAG: hypothetical protein QOH21_1754 [Acidobacteriota bacterium]|jgi:hypothetical protein|nr:hypothetical protein [Acidobacteriota bacterium]
MMKTLFVAMSFGIAMAAASAAAQDLPSTTANDASCDIALQPAATLLMPYFEVAADQPASVAKTTLVTITNVTNQPQIANVTIWTNLDRPVLNFPIFLTGYDVQSINLYDLLTRGVIAPPSGTSNATRPGSRSRLNGANPHFLASAEQACSRNSMPVSVPQSLLAVVVQALTTRPAANCNYAGATSETLATGYVTIDVVATCTLENASSANYWNVLLYDNVLTGDYEIVSPNAATGNYAEGNPLVHIRAVPEGGPAGSTTVSPLPFTFYDRLTPAGKRRTDRRQPLPSTFLSRFIEAGPTAFDTQLMIWREGLTGPLGTCDPTVNDTIVGEIVRFDERENPTARLATNGTIGNAESIHTTSGDLFPPATSDVGGWLYLNLNNGGSASYSADPRYDLVSGSSTVRGVRQSQAWVAPRMAAEGRYAVTFDATALGNGCSPAPASPTMAAAGATVRPIGPAPVPANDVEPVGTITHRNDDSCDIALQPAATLLLPYFQVAARQDRKGLTTLVTIVNTSSQPQIARATIWTDWAYPVITFDIFLTGYDVQAINLYDVLVNGLLPGNGPQNSPTGSRSVASNPSFLPSAQTSCAQLPLLIPPSLAREVLTALGYGTISTCGSGSTAVGFTHGDAVGYMTFDLVATCSAKAPGQPGAAGELLYDNVLTGDYQLVDANPATGNYALGSPLVHVRAVPEGGNAGQTIRTSFARTFYQRFTGGTDRRQPLPSTFASRYIQGGSTGFKTNFTIWREAPRLTQTGCPTFAALDYVETVRFDERENPTALTGEMIDSQPFFSPGLQATTRISSEDRLFPPLESCDVAGWMYFNLAVKYPFPDEFANQAWITTTMHAEGRYGVAFDATAMSNGCTPAPRQVSDTRNPIGPGN